MSTQKIFKVVGLGEILWDLFPGGKLLGGAPANFAYHINVLGNQGLAVSSVGSDELGREILDTLQGEWYFSFSIVMRNMHNYYILGRGFHDRAVL